MARKLATHVYARDENGRLRSYGPGDDVPAAVARQITLSSAWADEGESKPKASAGGNPQASTPEPAEKPVESRSKRKQRPAEGTTQDKAAE